MDHRNDSLLKDGSMAHSYSMPDPDKIQVSVSTLDELSLPVERRGYSIAIPRNPDDRAAAATRFGEAVEKTARLMMGLSIEEAGN